MAEFNRFDICAAYNIFSMMWGHDDYTNGISNRLRKIHRERRAARDEDNLFRPGKGPQHMSNVSILLGRSYPLTSASELTVNHRSGQIGRFFTGTRCDGRTRTVFIAVVALST